MNFSEALILIKSGEALQRKGWNGKGLHIFLVKGNAVEQAIADSFEDCKKLPVHDAIYMKTSDDKLVPWLASQTDMLAEDWQVL